MVSECDCVRFRTVAGTGVEPWLELWPELGPRHALLLSREEFYGLLICRHV